MHIVLFDTTARTQLYPFSLIRPLAALRSGIFTMQERWSAAFEKDTFTLSEAYLQQPVPNKHADGLLYINASAVFSHELFNEVRSLAKQTALYSADVLIAVSANELLTFPIEDDQLASFKKQQAVSKIELLAYPFDLVRMNDALLRMDFAFIQQTREAAAISSTNTVINPEQIFIEEGAEVEYCHLNASAGPIYIGKNALLMEGAMIRGPFAALDEAVVKMGAKIYGATSVGRKCTVGGEIKNAVFFDYSNKAHDGYIGDAVIGSWCNIGAGASCSNVKNTASDIKVWNQPLRKWIAAGNKCGVMLGDYTRVSINSSLTTGMVSGISANIVSNRLSPKYVTDFTWDVATGEKYFLHKALQEIENWMQMKNKSLTNEDKSVVEYLYGQL
ncbi:UDP-N-acetylglucosamine diphosphorylase/glucosamine-1-phosphate N-acetyltransferase [Lacibacter cauensis]|uniref:UDP-N-acetylglucosamine diphosphorylase/glucosamine-1-phosphate N-acetyltransferase n=1 Tax=Lacibacter cauensis TaxID=510947 RepID=A0A562SWI7_9BACT|nr:putative sugar nucleotidyl transferase [Lacibacter cauensis]TWI85667.1 UDP-N-acetylglucosamine diphosphorylase/glucosamine-1-phosphate N-acetyltransferase [Lacibacter cauensis]